MSSIIDRAQETLGSGRKRIGLFGRYKDKDVTVDVDCTTTFTLTENAAVTNHPIESEQTGNTKQITDYVIPAIPSLALDILLSDNLGLKSTVSAGLAESDSVSMKDKIKILTFWQKTGTVITLLGYKTGQNIAGKVMNYLTSGIQNFFDSKDENAFYTGMDTDVIPNLVLSNITWKRNQENGLDVAATVNLQKIQMAVPKTGTKKTASSSGTGSAKKPQEKGNTPTPPAQIKTSTAFDLGKKIPKP